MTTHLLFLFGSPDVLLGEITVRDGAYGQAMLTRAGEARLGSVLPDWQAQQANILFEPALQQWCATQQIAVVTLASDIQIACAQELLGLLFTSAEQSNMLRAIAAADADALIEWQQFLAQAHTIFQEERRKAQAEVEKWEASILKDALKKMKITTT